MQECPEATSFRRYMRGGLPEDSVDRFERHIQECGSCLSRLIALGQVDSAPTVPQCHIVGQLGSGRFGVVYKAWWLGDTPRLVALKCLSYSGEIERERFDREIKVLRQIDSPHIVKCLASGITGGTHYFVMDLIRGEHLDEYVANRATDLDHKLAIFQRVCLAVAEAHAKGVIHRDLKPRNILVDAAGEPHILDFGICALEAEDWSSSACHTITRFGDIIGTLKYMSPEQAWGGVSGPIDERSDIWALGIMLHEIVTDGGYPYSLTATAERPAHEALLERIRKEMPTLPRLGFVDRGRQLEILLERCLSWEPEKRLNSAQQLAEDIGRYRARQRITTKPFSAPHRIHRLAIGVAARSRWAIQLALVATVAVVLWAAAYFFDIRWGVDGAVHAGRASAAWTAPPSFGGSAARMVIAGVSDSTASSVVAFARAKGIPGVNHEVTSWRAVHGCLMRRLAGVKPAVVVWDYFFEVPRPGDAGFVAGLEALDEAGVPVVLAARTYRADGTPKLSETLTTMPRRRVRHGSIFARDMVDREGQFVMAIRRPSGEVVPALALATLGAVLHPDAHVDIDWSERAPYFDMLYATAPGSYLRTRDRLDLTKVFSPQHSQLSVSADDIVGCKAFDLSPPSLWAARTVPYEELLTCSLDRLRAHAGEKVVVVGDLRTRSAAFPADRHRVKYAGAVVDDVPGCYLLCDAIAGLLDGRHMASAFPLPPTTFLLMLLLAICGGLLPVGLARSRALESARNRRLLCSSLASVCAACLVVMVSLESYSGVHVGMAGFSLLMPMCGSFWVEFARGRHRILDRERRSVESLVPDTDRTITMRRWRASKLPAEQ